MCLRHTCTCGTGAGSASEGTRRKNKKQNLEIGRDEKNWRPDGRQFS
jgi:hypothetical protein